MNLISVDELAIEVFALRGFNRILSVPQVFVMVPQLQAKSYKLHAERHLQRRRRQRRAALLRTRADFGALRRGRRNERVEGPGTRGQLL